MKSPRSRSICPCSCNARYIYLLLLVTASVSLCILVPFIERQIEEAKPSALTICMNTTRWYEAEVPQHDCHASQRSLEQRLYLLSDISQAFTEADIHHWLCYGTLWGVIRGGKLLEYDRDGDICTVRVSEEVIEKILVQLGDEIYYRKNFTSFHVWRDLAEVHITLYQYTNIPNDNTDEHKIIRQGYRRDFVPNDCVAESFPERFIRYPLRLPRAKLNDIEFPVPHEGYEIQMYVYPANWHTITKPVGCT